MNHKIKKTFIPFAAIVSACISLVACGPTSNPTSEPTIDPTEPSVEPSTEPEIDEPAKVYFKDTRMKDKMYAYALNGQTGKIVGKLPMDKLKLFLIGGGSFVAIDLLFALFSAFAPPLYAILAQSHAIINFETKVIRH